MKSPNRSTITQPTNLPNIGKAMARDFRLVNIQHPKDLIGKDGYQLYDKLCRTTGKRHDPYVIDVFSVRGGINERW